MQKWLGQVNWRLIYLTSLCYMSIAFPQMADLQLISLWIGEWWDSGVGLFIPERQTLVLGPQSALTKYPMPSQICHFLRMPFLYLDPMLRAQGYSTKDSTLLIGFFFSSLSDLLNPRLVLSGDIMCLGPVFKPHIQTLSCSQSLACPLDFNLKVPFYPQT